MRRDDALRSELVDQCTENGRGDDVRAAVTREYLDPGGRRALVEVIEVGGEAEEGPAEAEAERRGQGAVRRERVVEEIAGGEIQRRQRSNVGGDVRDKAHFGRYNQAGGDETRKLFLWVFKAQGSSHVE
jgi:hypothetical protein